MTSLEIVDKAKHVYLFEAEESWIGDLEKTFAPWKEKVTIVRKYVSDIDDDNNVRLDSFFNKSILKPTFIKIDVEGAEMNVLNGCASLFTPHQAVRKPFIGRLWGV